MTKRLMLLFLAPGFACLAQNPAYTVAVGAGLTAIANHYDQGRNLLGEVLPQVPPETRLHKWNPATQTFHAPAEFIPGVGWVPATTTLRPGEGAFIEVPAATTFTFAGRLHTPGPRLDAVVGLNFVSCQVARTCSFEEVMGFDPKPGDRVYEFAQTLAQVPTNLKTAASSVYNFGARGWNTTPQFPVGRSAFVELSGYPRFILQPASRHVTAGQTAAFTSRALGAAPLRFQWRRNGQALPGGTNSTLTLAAVTAAHAGAYTVEVSNSLGSSISSTAFLFVASSPVIVEEPMDMTVVEGRDAKFMVRAAGSPPLHYSWRRGTQGQIIAQGALPSLIISNATIDDADAYYVVVTNRSGSAMSQPARLDVLLLPRIVRQPDDQQVRLGDSAAFRVVAAGTAPLRYQWRHNGVIIPGATDNVLSIPEVGLADAGAYRVAVVNPAGAVISETAHLVLDAPPLPFGDGFPGGSIAGASGYGAGNNLRATREPGETNHVGLRGGRSLWLTWSANDSGIVTFSTAGSGFDTLLAVYVGDKLDRLHEVASDDDGGPAHTSRVQFNVVAGQEYRIAVDGFNDEAGDLILSWVQEITSERLPEIIRQPRSVATVYGGKVSFDIEARADQPLTFQWFRNDKEIPFAREPALQIAEVGTNDIGVYFVRIGSGNRFIVSRPVRLEIHADRPSGQPRGELTVDKLAELHRDDPARGAADAGELLPASFVLGYVDSREFDLGGSTLDQGEPLHCGVVGGASRWLSYRAPASGVLHVRTDGSDFDTVLGAYTGRATNYAGLTPVACDDNSGLDGMDSYMSFAVTQGTTYLIAVDGVGGAKGRVVYEHVLLVPMVLTNAVRPGLNEHRFSVTATPSYPASIEYSDDLINWQWLITTQTLSGTFEFRRTNVPPTASRHYRGYQMP